MLRVLCLLAISLVLLQATSLPSGAQTIYRSHEYRADGKCRLISSHGSNIPLNLTGATFSYFSRDRFRTSDSSLAGREMRVKISDIYENIILESAPIDPPRAKSLWPYELNSLYEEVDYFILPPFSNESGFDPLPSVGSTVHAWYILFLPHEDSVLEYRCFLALNRSIS